MKTHKKPKLCVYCGSSNEVPKRYVDTAKVFVQAAVARGYDIVYGAGSCGLMGVVANAALEAGAHVTGVVPHQFVKEVVHQNLSEKILTNSMSERKRVMLDISDAFVALPGGYGTLDEISEALILLQLGAFKKPCGFLNTNNFYDKLLEFFDVCVTEKFVSPMHREMALMTEDPNELLDKIQNYSRPEEKLWWNEKL